VKIDDQRLGLGSLGCGPIARAAHPDPLRQARNADPYAVGDIAEGLTGRPAAIYQPRAVYNTFAAMLADTVPGSGFDGRTFESFSDGAGI
jgi:predicted dehydrogenase